MVPTTKERSALERQLTQFGRDLKAAAEAQGKDFWTIVEAAFAEADEEDMELNRRALFVDAES